MIKSDTNRKQVGTVAYFSAEFGLSDKLPIFSGGLGVLAGDVLKEANDQGLPFVAVSLFYHHGYFRQIIDEYGEQVEVHDYVNSLTAGLELVKSPDGGNLIIDVPVLNRTVHIKVWRYMVGDISLFLLDTDIAQNEQNDREITRHLYSGNMDIRIKQEMVLGIGGERVLYSLGIHPRIYHLNEGHSAFAVFEITHHAMREHGMRFEEAYQRMKKRIVFTNHTLVPAGNDVFPKERLRHYLGTYARNLGLSINEILDKGTITDKPQLFGMTILALNMSCRANAVSKIHSDLAMKIWPNQNMVGITNGVHLPTWVHPEITDVSGGFDAGQLDRIHDVDLWRLHRTAKKELMRFLMERIGVEFNYRVATIVWARRFATYKRPDLLFSEIETLRQLSASAHGALQVIIAGKAHPDDNEGKAIIKYINETIKKENLYSWVVFVPDYSMNVAKYFVAGADVWLNTPIRGHEASGTSGMKAGANGVLQCSTRDGWVDEVDWAGIGWILSDADTAGSLYNIIEQEVLPIYYTLNQRGWPQGWVYRMRKTMKIVWEQYSSTRMMDEYIDRLYQYPRSTK